MTYLLAVRGNTKASQGVAEASAAELRREEFGRLAAAELPACYRLAVRILGDRGEAEDAVNEAILRAWSSFGGLRDPKKFRQWLARIVVNTCRNVLERRKIVPIEPIGDRDPQAADPFESGHTRDAIELALGRLSPDQRIAIALRYWNDLSVDEIARLTGVPSGTVKWRLHTACRRLRNELAGLGWEETR